MSARAGQPTRVLRRLDSRARCSAAARQAVDRSQTGAGWQSSFAEYRVEFGADGRVADVIGEVIVKRDVFED